MFVGACEQQAIFLINEEHVNVALIGWSCFDCTVLNEMFRITSI